MSIHVERLRWPEEENGEEIGAGYESDYECQRKNARALLQACWEHRKLGEFGFPDGEGDE